MTTSPLEPEVELALAAQLREGDSDALREILTLLGPLVARRLVNRFGHCLNSEDLEEVLSTALLHVWQQRRRYDPARGSLLPWFYLLARHAAVDLLRARSQRQAPAWLKEREAIAAPPEMPPAIPSERLARLEDLLQSLGEEDRDILLAFAASSGEGAWTAEVAARLGVSPNHISVRKKRLLEKLRRQLRDESSVEGEAEGTEPMIPNRKWLEPLRKVEVRKELIELAKHLAAVCAQSVEHGREPRRQFALEWNRGLKTGELREDPERLLTLQKAWCRMEGLLQAGRRYRNRIVDFARWCRKDPGVAESELYQQPEELVVERLQRAIVGVADAIERRMPRQVRQARKGDVRLDWKEPADQLDAQCAWVTTPPSPAFALLLVSQTSMQRYAELSPPENTVFANLLLRGIWKEALDLPDFQRVQSDGRQTLLRWQPERIEALPLENAPTAANRLAEPEEIPYALELELWKRFPAAAEAVDATLCAAAVADYQQGISDEPGREPRTPEKSPHAGAEKGSAVEEVVRILQELTGRPAEEVVLLLAPLLERRVESDPATQSSAPYQRALGFLWSQLSPQ